MRLFFLATLFSTFSEASSMPIGEWHLEKSNLTYEVTHKLKKFKGTSTQARGKAICEKLRCQIVFAVPISSFDSGDSSRDLHVLEASLGGRHKLASATAVFDPDFKDTIKVMKMEVKFAGFTKNFKDLEFIVKEKSQSKIAITGMFPLKLTDFGLERPTFLTMQVHDDVPVSIEMVWIKK